MSVLWLVLALSCLVLQQVQSNKYEGYKIYELPKAKARSAVLDQALAVLSMNDTHYEVFSSGSQPARIMVHPEEQLNFVQLLDGHSLNYRVLNSNVGRTLRRQFATDRKLRNKFPYRGNGRLGTERFYSHGEINQYIEDLAQEQPRRVFVKTVGRSYERRLMKTVTITNGDGRRNKNVILVDGGFHAREWISPATVVYLIDELVNNLSENADLLLDYDWVILPVVNPDGYEYTQLSEDTRMWRKTRKPSSADCIGTDPNRNFDFHWNEGGASDNPCADTYAGSNAFSEPEAQVVSDLIHSHAARGKMYLTLHSFGPYILYPWGWTSDLPDTVADLHEVAQAGFDAILADTGTFYEIGSSTNKLYVAAGASDDYAFNAGFPISFTMELPPGGTGFDPPASAIDRMVKETFVGIAAMARKVVQKYPLA
ncbi:carboxypeptidase B [Drosophila guanche]|uniref:Blast:Carboxypeptidase B n=1 Tax=Drosophila guanche TaxID=7266 RepID=A0A3B0JAZ8_DROGU|nr:carboxypeptidase B [Drosophila guanche]SPP77182.1 blast:Carboxypeptidase B [Drosophila guanche]